MSASQRVLVTGSAGHIGRAVCRALQAAGHSVRGLDIFETPGVPGSHIGSITEPATLDSAMDGIDIVIHLAAQPDEADFVEELVPKNVIGVYQVFDAVVRANIGRLVYASSCQVVNARIKMRNMTRIEDGPAATNHYGLLKLWGEQLGEMYWRLHQLSVLSVRIGWLPRSKKELESFRTNKLGRDIYLSHNDAGRFFCRAVEKDWTGSRVVFVTSRPAAGERVDLQAARDVTGYEPCDVYPAGWHED